MAPAPDPEELLSVARRCADRAGRILLEHFARPREGVRTKSRATDLVSAADFAAEDAIRGVLAEARPADGVLGEERPETPSASGLRWVVDPLDGTANFVHGIPHWSVSVACEDGAGPLVGVVADPLRGECFHAARGGGAFCDGARLAASEQTELALATVGGEFTARSPAQADCVRRLVAAVGYTRDYGSAALDLAWVALGRFDAVYHGRFPQPWDVAAGRLLCEEAGAVVERVDAGEDSPRLIAAPPALAAQLRRLACE